MGRPHWYNPYAEIPFLAFDGKDDLLDGRVLGTVLDEPSTGLVVCLPEDEPGSGGEKAGSVTCDSLI